MTPPRRRFWLNLARAVISLVLLAWVVRSAGLAQLLQAARGARLAPYLLAVALGFVGIGLRALRWQVLLNAVGARVPFGRTLYLYFVGAFFNTVLPTGFGGDVVRVLEVGPGATSQQAAGTTVVDRLTGFVVLFVLALAALPFAAGLLPPGAALLIALLAVGVMLGSALLFEGRLLRAVTRRLPAGLSLAGESWLGRTYAVITACGRDGLLRALWWSLMFNLSLILAAILVGRALNVPASPWVYFVFVPVTTVALLVPVSVAGLGVREGLYAALFAPLGVAPAQAVALSLAIYSLDLLAGLAGGGLYLLAGLLGLRGRVSPPA